MECGRKQSMISYVLFLGILLFFGIKLVIDGVQLCEDSNQYIMLHIHREPLYSIFLLVVRSLFKSNWLYILGAIQCLLAAYAIYFFAKSLRMLFVLPSWMEIGICIIGLVPYLATEFFSQTHIFLPCIVLTEAVTLPFFLFFIIELCKYIMKPKAVWNKHGFMALLWAMLMSLTRGQLMVTFIVWAITVIGKVLFTKSNHQARNISLCIIIFVGAFLLRDVSIKSYNYAANGHFIGNTYGNVSLLSNFFYFSDENDGEKIKDETARELFYSMYHLAEQNGQLEKSTTAKWSEKVAHLEDCHDKNKHDVIEATLREYSSQYLSSDYIEQEMFADHISGILMKVIVPKHFDSWLLYYIFMVLYGLVRAIGIVHPIINLVVLVIYALSVFLTISAIKKRKIISEHYFFAAIMMSIVILNILGNVTAVAIAIMPLSRYVIYGFTPFYSFFSVLIYFFLKQRGRKGALKDGKQNDEKDCLLCGKHGACGNRKSGVESCRIFS